MTAIFIRLKNLVIFGLVLLCVSLVWISLSQLQKEGDTLQTIAENTVNTSGLSQNATVLETDLPTVTIEPEDKSAGKDDFFSEYRIERDRKRSEQVEILREIVNNPNSSAATRQEAQQKLLRVSDSLEKESKIENALVAKGFKDAVAVIQNQGVMVIVPSGGLRQDEIARVADMVVKVTGCKMEDVIIVPKSQ